MERYDVDAAGAAPARRRPEAAPVRRRAGRGLVRAGQVPAPAGARRAARRVDRAAVDAMAATDRPGAAGVAGAGDHRVPGPADDHDGPAARRRWTLVRRFREPHTADVAVVHAAALAALGRARARRATRCCRSSAPRAWTAGRGGRVARCWPRSPRSSARPSSARTALRHALRLATPECPAPGRAAGLGAAAPGACATTTSWSSSTGRCSAARAGVPTPCGGRRRIRRRSSSSRR